MKTRRMKGEVEPPSWPAVVPLLVLAVVASVIWGLVSVVPLAPAVLMASELDNYRPARFVVDDVVYRTSRRGADRYYAKGQIDGQREEFELSDVAPVVETREALERYFGQQPVTFAVMYNPNRMRAKRNDGSTRVLPAREGFAESYRKEAWLAVFNSVGSLVAAGFALITLRSISQKSKKK